MDVGFVFDANANGAASGKQLSCLTNGHGSRIEDNAVRFGKSGQIAAVDNKQELVGFPDCGENSLNRRDEQRVRNVLRRQTNKISRDFGADVSLQFAIDKQLVDIQYCRPGTLGKAVFVSKESLDNFLNRIGIVAKLFQSAADCWADDFGILFQ